MATVSLRGELPKPWGTNEWAWRQAIANAVQAQLKGAEEYSLPDDSYFEVTITFYLPRSTFAQTDLDNLAKPVLDTLFHAKYPQAKIKGVTGTLLRDVDDGRVVSLFLKKQLVESEEQAGVDISVQRAV